MKVGYARVSTQGQDVEAQRQGLIALGVDLERIYIDEGLTGTTRDRPALGKAMAACHVGDELVVTKLDRLARSVPDARDIAAELETQDVKLNLGGSIYDPTDPVGRLLFNVLSMVAEFESDLIRQRTREGMAIARQRGRLRGKPPKLPARQEANLVRQYESGETTVGELAEDFAVHPSTVYRIIKRAQSENSSPQTRAQRPRQEAGE